MVDWLVAWGVAQAGFFVFKPILENLAQDAAKEYTKDFFKDCLKKVIHLPNTEPLQIATGKAIKEFLQLFEEQLTLADIEDEVLKQYIKPLKHFIKKPKVAATLGNVFNYTHNSLDTQILAQTWHELENAPDLPDEFNWEDIAKLYQKKVKRIRQESNDLRKIIDSENLATVADNVAVKPDFDLEKYREGIQEKYGNLKLESLDTSGYAYNELKLWRMFIEQNVRECQDFLPQIYELPKDYRKRLKESGELEGEFSLEDLEQRKKAYSEQQNSQVLQLVNNKSYPYLVILGDPGSGKSTLLQYLALQWTEIPLKDLPLHPIPLLIELRTYIRNFQEKQCKDFLEFLHQGSGIICRFPQQKLHEKLKSGQVLVLFDGLDEVFNSAQRETIITDIHRFTNDYPKVRVIVTSRVIGYKHHQLRDAGFRHFMLQDLEEEQIEAFIQRWHDLTYDDESEKVRKRDRLKKAIEQSSAIRELGGNPLLLTMMAILNRNQELPRDRGELYNQASRVLLHQWDAERQLQSHYINITIDYKDKQEMLRNVAYFMQQNSEGFAGNIIHCKDLENTLTKSLITLSSEPRTSARLLIDQLRNRNFILCSVGADYYAFVHRTFLEYFCAWSFVWKFKEERTLTLEQLIETVFAPHWQDESWHEVLRLIAGMLDGKFVSQIIEFLISQSGESTQFMNLFLAADCLAEVRNRQPIREIAKQLLQEIKQLAEYDFPYYYKSNDRDKKFQVSKICIEAINKVATIWKDDPEVLQFLKNAVDDEDSFVRWAAVKSLAQEWKDDPEVLLFFKNAVAHQDSHVRQVAVESLAQGWKDNPEVLLFLKNAVDDEDSGVRRVAVESLAQGWKDNPEVLLFLKNTVTHENSDVRQAAVESLAQGWKDDPEVLQFLKNAVTHENSDVRRAAVRSLAQGWKDDPEVLPLLKNAVDDEDSGVRWAAVESLAQGWKDDPEVLLLLKNAVDDEDSFVRWAAVESLAQGWKDDPEVLLFFKNAVAHQDSHVRQVAVESLAQGWKDDPEVLQFLKNAVTHENSDVRRAAVRSLAQGWKDDPEVLPLLKNAVDDEDSGVRRVAVENLAQGWKDNPEVLQFLKNTVTHENSDVRRAAVRGLAQGWKDNPEVLLFLKNAVTHENSDVRRAAVESLAQGWKDDPEVLLLLKNAVDDQDSHVRRAAVRSLAQGWKDDPEVLLLLKNAVADQNSSVRETAIFGLARYYWNDPDLFEIVYHCAVHDPFIRQRQNQNHPRETALRILIKLYPTHPQLIPLLQDRAKNDPDHQVQKLAENTLKKWKQKTQLNSI